MDRAIKQGHREAAEEIGVDTATMQGIETLLGELEQLLVGISIMQVLAHSVQRLSVAASDFSFPCAATDAMYATWPCF